MKITLRTAVIEDAAHVARVLLSSRAAFLPYVPWAHGDSEVRQWVREVLIPSRGVTVACVDAEVAGVLATSHEDDASWIDQLYVAPHHVGRGIGSRLLSHALTTLAPPLRLHTFQANLRARTFYERHGFRAIAWGDGSGNEEQCPDVLYELGAPRDDRI